jgi:hypothetical protein
MDKPTQCIFYVIHILVKTKADLKRPTTNNQRVVQWSAKAHKVIMTKALINKTMRLMEPLNNPMIWLMPNTIIIASRIFDSVKLRNVLM